MIDFIELFLYSVQVHLIEVFLYTIGDDFC